MIGFIVASYYVTLLILLVKQLFNLGIYYYNLQANITHVVFSWSENDPANDDPENGPAYHGFSNRGSASLNLLEGLIDMLPEPLAGTVGSFNITMDNVWSVIIITISHVHACICTCMPHVAKTKESA